VLAREVGHARGCHVVDALAGAFGERDVRPAEQATRIVRERCRGRERGAGEGRAPRGGQTVPNDVANDQHGGVLRPFGHEVEVSADALRRGQDRRGELHARALRKLGWRQRIADRAEILELELVGLKPIAQVCQVVLPDPGL
jgi:hypothetical protein